MSLVKKQDPDVYKSLYGELTRERNQLELIASENIVSEAVLEAQGSVLTNKYAEGYPGKRYYGGCEYVDIAESLAIERAKKIFGAEHANVQPHSGTQANMAVYMMLLKPGDTVLGMNLAHGGHLSHGHPLNFSGIFYRFIPYGVRKDTEYIDYDELERLALEYKPKLIVAGASAYPRIIDFKRIHEIAQKINTLVMVDMAHIAGLVAAGVHPSPVPYADFVTSTTHKTLRGPRGGFIVCKEKYAKDLDRMVLPGIQGGPLMHVIAAKAVAFGEVLHEGFNEYQKQIVKNASALAKELKRLGFRLVSGGTDNHLMLIDLREKKITGNVVEKILDRAGITVNKNVIPFDPEKPFVTSGIRIGTPVVTTRGMKESEMKLVGQYIAEALKHKDDDTVLEEIKEKVRQLCQKFPIYKGIKSGG